MKPKIAKVVVGLPVEGPFDYMVGEDLRGRIAVGMRVRVSFNRRVRIGFIIGLAQRSALARLNPVLALLDEAPVIGPQALQLAEALSGHYGCSLGEAIEGMLPPALRSGRSTARPLAIGTEVRQKVAQKDRPVLVHDQTRYKRWPFIVEEIKKALSAKKGVIILVPEFVFIAQTVTVLQKALDVPVLGMDQKLGPKQDLERWEEVRRGAYPVVVGVRSAVFLPAPDLGLIVVDEEENEAYKQEQPPHYRAPQVAEMRAKIAGCRVVFAGAVPTAEIWEKARRGKWEKITFTPDHDAAVKIVDMSNYNRAKTSILSFPLQNAMQKVLEEGGKVLLFMNRRGFATRTHCQQCGYTVRCERCNVNLTYLYSKKVMVCRHCNFQMELPKLCPQCNGAYLRSTGVGVEKLESEVARLYPQARVGRCDSGHALFGQDADILIATGAVFRRHEPWTVKIVAMLNFDDQLHHHDFRSGQKAFSLLIHLKQLAGEQLLVQTRMPDNYCIRAVTSMDFSEFYREELKSRKELGLPPYKCLVGVGVRGENEETVFELGQALYERLQAAGRKGIEISDLHPEAVAKKRDQYRHMILLKGSSVNAILTLIKSVLKGFKKKNVTIAVDVDP